MSGSGGEWERRFHSCALSVSMGGLMSSGSAWWVMWYVTCQGGQVAWPCGNGEWSRVVGVDRLSTSWR